VKRLKKKGREGPSGPGEESRKTPELQSEESEPKRPKFFLHRGAAALRREETAEGAGSSEHYPIGRRPEIRRLSAPAAAGGEDTTCSLTRK